MSTERHDREFWEDAARQVEAGETVRAVAERLGVRPRTLSWWRWKLAQERPTRRRRRKAPTETSPTFLPVVLDGGSPQRAALELTVGDVHLRVEPGAEVDYVAALVRALRSC